MYRIVLTYRYLRSRWLTLVAMIATFLGVGSLVVVLAVMNGFVKDIRQSVRGGLADIIVEADITGFPYYDDFIARMKQDPNVAEATPAVQLYGMVQIVAEGPDAERNDVAGAKLSKPCMIFGIRPAETARVNRFTEYLKRQRNDASPSFAVPPSLADELKAAGRRVFPGCIPGDELVTWHRPHDSVRPIGTPDDSVLLVDPGARLVLTTLPIGSSGAFESTAGLPKPNQRAFTVVDYYKSRLYEFDSHNIFIPFEDAQALGNMDRTEIDGVVSPARAQMILVRLKNYDRAPEAIASIADAWNKLQTDHLFPLGITMNIQTWERRQATILSVIEVQRTLMIILLGLIILVAGFMIGAILAMIVKEKTRDIGILKSLGASSSGVARIFIGYAAATSGVGSLAGLAAGLAFVHYIDAIEAWASQVLGFNVFPRDAYYLDHIPRLVDPRQTALVAVSAVVLAVLCSTVAAWRAARLPPVEALRYE
jgi:lipoprotein-releasing system permease protein